MRTIRPGPGRVRRNTAVLMCVAAVSLFFVATGLLADPPDSTQPSLREGTFVMRDTTTHPPSPVSAKALERLNANSTERWNVQWHRTTGLPGIGGGVTKKKYEGSPEEIALAFVEDYKDLFLGTENPEVLADYSFAVSRVFLKERYTVVHLNQLYKGVKVYQAVLGVWTSDEPWLNRVNNNLHLVHMDNVTPSLTRVDIEQLIQKAAAPKEVVKSSEQRKTLPWSDVPVPEGSNPDTMELCILPSSPPRLVYIFVRFIDMDPHRYIVDAHTGEILSAYFMGVVDRFRSHPEDADTGESERDTNSIPGPMHPTPIPVYKVPGSERVLPDTQAVPDSTRPGQ